MMKEATIREFGFIIESIKDNPVNENQNLDYCFVSPESWLFLENLAYSNEKKIDSLEQLLMVEKKRFRSKILWGSFLLQMAPILRYCLKF